MCAAAQQSIASVHGEWLAIDLLSTQLTRQLGANPLHADNHYCMNGEKVAYGQLSAPDLRRLDRDDTDSERGENEPIHRPGSTVPKRRENETVAGRKAKDLAEAK